MATPFAGTKIARAIAVEFAANALLKLAMVCQTIVLARLFTPAQIGGWNTALLIVGAASTAVTFGLDRYLISGPPGDKRAQLDTAFTLSLLSCLIGIGAVVMIAPVLSSVLDSPNADSHIRTLSPLVLGVALTLPACTWEQQLRQGLPKIAPSLGVLTLMGTAVVLRVHWGMGAPALITAQLASFVVSSTTLWIMAPVRPRLAWNPKELRSQVQFGGPLLAAGLTGFVANQGDDLLVRYFTDDRSLGLYVVAFYLPGYLLTLVDVVGRVAIPVLAPLRESTAELKEVFEILSRYIAMVAVFFGCALALFTPDLIGLIYGREWLEAVPLVRLFAVAFILRAATGYHWYSLAVLFGRTRYIMWCGIASAAFMMVVGTPLIWRFGLLGGAYYSLAQLGIMGPLVRFPLIRQTLGDLSYLRGTVPSLLSGSVATTGTIGVWQATGYSGATPLPVLTFLVLFGSVLAVLDPVAIGRARSLIFKTRRGVGPQK